MGSKHGGGDSHEIIKVDFKISSCLGRGSSAEVRKAKHRSTGTNVAIKIIKKRKLSKAELNMYKSEVTALLQLNHPNVIDLFAFLEVENYLYIVTEFMKGGTLQDVISEQTGALPEESAKEICRALVDAIQYIHEQGYIHRDIKMENILLDKKDLSQAKIKISDFGFSKCLK